MNQSIASSRVSNDANTICRPCKIPASFWAGLVGLLIGSAPGWFMLWLVSQFAEPSQKFSVAQLTILEFLAVGILWVGLLVGGMFGFVTYSSCHTSSAVMGRREQNA